MSNNSTNFTCLICSGTLIWQSDFALSDLKEDESARGIVSFFSCKDCGSHTEAIYDESQDPRI